MDVYDLNNMGAGESVIDCFGSEWTKGVTGWVKEDTARLSAEHILRHFSPLTPSVIKRIEVSGRQPGWAGYDSEEKIMLKLMHDGTVRWER